jgi:hypothetical protein
MKYFLIFFLIFTIFLINLIVHSSLNHENVFLDKLTSKLGVISGFFITAALYLTYLIYESSINTTKKDITYKIIDRGWININHKILEYYNLCPNFADSLYFDWQKSE